VEKNGSAGRACIIQGGRPLEGEINVSGQRHAMNLCLAASIALNFRLMLDEVPATTETDVLAAILADLGVNVSRQADRMVVDPSRLQSSVIPGCRSKQIHGAVYLLPALLARTGCVTFSCFGGDALGDFGHDGGRPLSHILDVLEQFGCTFQVRADGTVRGSRPRHVPARIDVRAFSSDPSDLTGPLVSGATKTALLMAAATDGISEIANPHDNESINELIEVLQAAGISIEQQPRGWRIRGGGGHGEVISHRLWPDAAEAVSWIAAAVITGSSFLIRVNEPERLRSILKSELQTMRAMAASVQWTAAGIQVDGTHSLRAVDVVAHSMGVNTDIGPALAVMMLRGNGVSSLRDLVWGRRFSYRRQLRRLGADLAVHADALQVSPSRLDRPGQVLCPADTRSAAASTIAALAVPGRTVVMGADHLFRGYSRPVDKLRAIGADITVAEYHLSRSDIEIATNGGEHERKSCTPDVVSPRPELF
jgi:UDP-N-acetylglucosamine 1-carboxyvinyltransferase